MGDDKKEKKKEERLPHDKAKFQQPLITALPKYLGTFWLLSYITHKIIMNFQLDKIPCCYHAPVYSFMLLSVVSMPGRLCLLCPIQHMYLDLKICPEIRDSSKIEKNKRQNKTKTVLI